MLFLDVNNFCKESEPLWIFAGKCLLVFKIIIPVVLVILGVIGLGKAVIIDDEKETKTQVYKLIRKIIIAVCIFFVPTIVTSVISLVADWGNVDWKHCVECVGSPNNCKASDTSDTEDGE